MSNFGDALVNIKNGGTHRRQGWTPAMSNYIRRDSDTLITRHSGASEAPWVATNADLLAEDWVGVSEGSGQF